MAERKLHQAKTKGKSVGLYRIYVRIIYSVTARQTVVNSSLLGTADIHGTEIPRY